MSLDLEPLSHAGPDPDAIAAACPHARELSMARTLLSDWREVGRIVAALPDLRLVTISGNRMRPDTLDGALADLACVACLCRAARVLTLPSPAAACTPCRSSS